MAHPLRLDPHHPSPPPLRPMPGRPRPPARCRPHARARAVLDGLALGGAGAGLLSALMLIPERLDALLLVSTAIANVIGGLSRLGQGLLQLTAVLVVALLALFGLLLLLGGMVRLARALAAPRLASSEDSPSRLSRAGAPARSRPVARTTRGT